MRDCSALAVKARESSLDGPCLHSWPQAGRHPLLDRPTLRDAPDVVLCALWTCQDRLGDFEPIDIFMDGKCHFQTITGALRGFHIVQESFNSGSCR